VAAKYSDAEYEHDSDDEYDEDIGMWVRKSARKKRSRAKKSKRKQSMKRRTIRRK
jgi:hypothetical protein